MTDLENREAFEKWAYSKKRNIFRVRDMGIDQYVDDFVDGAWHGWQASAQREGFKLMPLEPSDDTVKAIANYLCETRSGTALEMSKSTYKAVINAV